jgi:hypothetical protein
VEEQAEIRDEVDEPVHEEVGELADGRTIRYFSWVGER